MEFFAQWVRYVSLWEMVELSLDIARTILAGFDKHYRIFRETSVAARGFFERQEWPELRRINRERNDLYNLRVLEAVDVLKKEFPEFTTGSYEELWPQIKKDYITMLYEHRQPELAETFFNSVARKVLHRRYHNNQYVFTRPAVATEHIESKQHTYRCYYPLTTGLSRILLQVFTDLQFNVPLVNPRRCASNLVRAFKKWIPRTQKIEPNFHIQVLSSLFYRNKAAYIVGRIVNGQTRSLFMIPLCHAPEGGLYADALIYERDQLANLLSVSNAYFMVDIEVPSSWVSFINAAFPDKPKSEIYTSIGLQRQGKVLFVRDLHQHLKHSADHFVIAPGIPGMVMLVFTMPSFPYVFKVIRDSFEPPKDTSRDQVMGKYRLVKQHDRVGRLADTFEYFDLAFPLSRFAPDLLEQMKRLIPSNLEIDGDYLIVKHSYVEQKMTPLNLFVQNADESQLRHAAQEYGQSLRDLAMVNIFPGDMLLKNFGMTNYGRVLFYDYDEVCYLTDCKFRSLPVALHMEDETRAEPWYSVGANDMFPEEFAKFLFKDDGAMHKVFAELHGDLMRPEFWVHAQEQIQAGVESDICLYPSELRFKRDPLAQAPILR